MRLISRPVVRAGRRRDVAAMGVFVLARTGETEVFIMPSPRAARADRRRGGCVVAERPLLNHSEMVYRPGDRDAARAFFDAMGFAVSEIPDFPWLVITVDPEAGWGVDNVMYANESTP